MVLSTHNQYILKIKMDFIAVYTPFHVLKMWGRVMFNVSTNTKNLLKILKNPDNLILKALFDNCSFTKKFTLISVLDGSLTTCVSLEALATASPLSEKYLQINTL